MLYTITPSSLGARSTNVLYWSAAKQVIAEDVALPQRQGKFPSRVGLSGLICSGRASRRGSDHPHGAGHSSVGKKMTAAATAAALTAAALTAAALAAAALATAAAS